MTAALGDVRQSERLRLSFLQTVVTSLALINTLVSRMRGGSTEYRLELLGRSAW